MCYMKIWRTYCFAYGNLLRMLILITAVGMTEKKASNFKNTNDYRMKLYFMIKKAIYLRIQGVPGGMRNTSGECSLC